MTSRNANLNLHQQKAERVTTSRNVNLNLRLHQPKDERATTSSLKLSNRLLVKMGVAISKGV